MILVIRSTRLGNVYPDRLAHVILLVGSSSGSYKTVIIVMIRFSMWMLVKCSEVHLRPTLKQSYGLSIQM